MILKKEDDKRGISHLVDIVGKFAASVHQENGAIIFAGAGISVPAPSSCPTWSGLRREIIGQFIDKLQKENWPIKSHLSDSRESILEMEMRPETFMWALTTDIGLDTVLQMISGIDKSVPNINHASIASLARNGILRGIITSNFDTYIEKSFNINNIPYTPIRDSHEINEWAQSTQEKIPLYKPHGCLSKPSSMKYRIDQIQKLPWIKKELLADLLKSAPVLIIGYSGNDEDIFPVIQRSLAESQFSSFVCVYPSPAYEPIQKWDLSNLQNVRRAIGESHVVLGSLSALLNKQKEIKYHVNTENDQFHSSNLDWKEHLANKVKEVPHDIIAMTISHLCSLYGNHPRALSFANLAQDICEDTNLSSSPRKSLMFIKELQSRAQKELGQGYIARANQNRRLMDALEGDKYEEVIDALIDRAHVALRDNDLESAERDLDIVAIRLSKMLQQDPNNIDYDLMSCLWYLGILKRKQSKTEESDKLFNQAIAIAHANEDIIHEGRIFLDYGYVKCQKNDWESAQQVWALAASLAEQANEWGTAAKAAKNRGILLSASDKPHLGRPELERALMLFKRACDPEGIKRAEEAIGYSESELMLAALSFGKIGLWYNITQPTAPSLRNPSL